MANDAFALLQAPKDTNQPTFERAVSHYNPLHTFRLPKGADKHYHQQYADMYFTRLAQLKPVIEQIAEEWDGYQLAGEQARRVERVLDVRQGELCWIVGTVYMDMPLKPNVLDDIGKEHWISAPPPREKYVSASGDEEIMLEDESGRLRLAGDLLQSTSTLVTGCIIAALGTENADGVFEVIATKVADLPRQPQRWERDDSEAALKGNKVKQQQRQKCGKVAIVSGLGISGSADDPIHLDMLLEYLLGEAATGDGKAQAANISRLIIAGNSLWNSSPIPAREDISVKKANKKYGYDASSYNPLPTESFDVFLASLLPSMPVTLLPGETDPASVSIPQQPLHPALFPQSRAYTHGPATQRSEEEENEPEWLDSVTNPWEGDIDGWRFLGTGGQPVDDVFKYVEGDDRLGMMENMLRWRCNAPTAPDTLWAYPFQDEDPLLMKECPHVYFCGNQPSFGTTVIEGPAGQQVRLITVPKFCDTGEVVLLDMETLDTEVIAFEVFGEV